MAKVGAGDSRWIVSHRSDGKNVDNWHWTEKDLFSWCQNQFEQKFTGVPITSTKANLKILKAESVQGSMVVCNRKGKTFYIFDVKIKLEWEGKLKDNEEVTAKGSINIEDIANDEDKWKWTVRIENESSTNRPMKEEIQNNAGTVIDNIINNILEEMKASIQDEGAEKTTPETVTEAPKPKPVAAEPKSKIIQTSNPTKEKSKIYTKSFSQKIVFEVPPQLLYETLLDANRVSAFTGGASKVENKVGGQFILFDGAVQGTQVELVPSKKIVQKWRFQTWPENHFSNVTFAFEQQGSSSTILTLTQLDIPSSDFERTTRGWETFFWQRIRGLFGWSFKIN